MNINNLKSSVSSLKQLARIIAMKRTGAASTLAHINHAFSNAKLEYEITERKLDDKIIEISSCREFGKVIDTSCLIDDGNILGSLNTELDRLADIRNSLAREHSDAIKKLINMNYRLHALDSASRELLTKIESYSTKREELEMYDCRVSGGAPTK